MKFQIPKGLYDILPYGCKEEWQLSDHWHHVENEIRSITSIFGFSEIRTPLFEAEELFSIGVGQQSDIVTKEMYTFKDKADRSLVLRPEGTSSILRAFVEKQLYLETKVHKLFYIMPMFRYERPQSGRYRQHYQFGAEVLGVASYRQDAEIIDMLLQFYKNLGLKDLQLQINSIGDLTTRDNYRKALTDYLSPFKEKLSQESQIRLEKNPLRILDSKDKEDQKIVVGAPSIIDFLSDEAKEHFEGVIGCLDQLGISYHINPKIVRGLDYYNKTVFEVTSNALGAQNAIGAGGRYDGFTALFKGPSLPGIGFGSGIERIIQTMIAQNIFFEKENRPFIFFAPLGDKARSYLYELTHKLRVKKIATEIDLSSKKMHEALARADKLDAKYLIVLGDSEFESGKVQLKEMSSRQEEEISLDKIEEILQQKWTTR